MILVLHANVPGRIRLKIQGLLQSMDMKRKLEEQLVRLPGIEKASANHRTGNLLLHYNPGRSLHWLVDTVSSFLDGSMAVHSKPATPSRGFHPDDPSAELALIPTGCPEKTSSRGLKKAIRRLLPAPDRPPEAPWHAVSVADTLECFDVQPDYGLSEQVAADRLRQYGSNTLPPPSIRSRWRIFANQFASLPVALLGAAAGISVITGGIIDAAVIMGVVVANAIIGYVTESSAERAIHSLKERSDVEARVVRDGVVIDIPSAEVALGDVLILRPGTIIPADARIVSAGHLKIDESMLTGESMPVEKTSSSLHELDPPLGDRTNMAYMGTLITGGQGKAVVVGTGRLTELGRLQAMLDETESPPTPVEEQLDRVGDQLVLSCLAICAFVFGLGWLRGQSFLINLRNAIALAAAAVPEGLPAAATTTFALGINRMREHNVLVRDLEAITTLGAVQVVCLDKTGTITENRMSVERAAVGSRMLTVSGDRIMDDGDDVSPREIEELRRLVEVCVLCNEAEVNGGDHKNGWFLNGSATENALLDLAFKAGIDPQELRKSYKREDMNHRSENRPYMSAIHVDGEGKRLCSIKGSPADVLSLCKHRMINGRKIALTPNTRRAVLDANEAMAGDAMRVLGAAFSDCEGDATDPSQTDLIWLGLVGLADPIREGVPELIQAFHRAGIDTIMITGDQKPTAVAVAEKLGLNGSRPINVMDSHELDTLSPEELAERVKDVQVFARVSPSHKLNIVRTLQRAGMVVAMTGDGINDGPALKAAEVGIAMGRNGADAARDIADVVLGEDDLDTLIAALRDGRTTQANIRKSVHFFLSTNMSEIMVMTGGLALGIGAPLNTMQLLWINLISDIFPGLALSLEEPEPGVLDRPPRDPEIPLFSRKDWARMAAESGVISASTLGVYAYGLTRYGGAGAVGLAFQTLTIGQLLHAFSSRSDYSAFKRKGRLPRNNWLNLAMTGSLLLQGLTMFVPALRNLLGLVPLSLPDLGVIAAGSMVPLIINEALKPGEAEARVTLAEFDDENPIIDVEAA